MEGKDVIKEGIPAELTATVCASTISTATRSSVSAATCCVTRSAATTFPSFRFTTNAS